MKITHFLALIAALCSACSFVGEPPNNFASVEPIDGKVVGTIRGAAGIVGVQGDLLEFAHGTVKINGKPVGSVPDVCEIQYIVDGDHRTLYVNGKQHALPEIPPPTAVVHIGG